MPKEVTRSWCRWSSARGEFPGSMTKREMIPRRCGLAYVQRGYESERYFDFSKLDGDGAEGIAKGLGSFSCITGARC